MQVSWVPVADHATCEVRFCSRIDAEKMLDLRSSIHLRGGEKIRNFKHGMSSPRRGSLRFSKGQCMSATPLRLFHGLPAIGLPSPSPACLKLAVWLRMQGIPYTDEVVDLSVAPKGKMPYVELDGKLLGDSTLIIEHLKQTRGLDPDRCLSPVEAAVALAFRRMLKENFYWVIIHDRWANDENFAAYAPLLGASIFPSMPTEEAVAFLTEYREVMLQQLHGQGLGRHKPAEVHLLGIADVHAVANYLGDKPFFMGDTPTTVDATVYAYMAHMIRAPFPSPVRDAGLECENLLAYLKRIHHAYFSGGEGKDL